jgi:multiple antibiotic resistance protein
VSAVAASALALVMLKALYDFVQARHQALLERYLDITVRVIAMFDGTYAVEMIAKGVALWLKQYGFGAPEL